MPAPARMRQVMLDTDTVAGFLTVMTVLSRTTALLGWLGENSALETAVTVCDGITVSVALAEVVVVDAQPLALLVTTQS